MDMDPVVIDMQAAAGAAKPKKAPAKKKTPPVPKAMKKIMVKPRGITLFVWLELSAEQQHNAMKIKDPEQRMTEFQRLTDEIEKKNEDRWVACDKCEKWRLLPKEARMPEDGEEWFCWYNPDKKKNKCTAAEQKWK